MLQRKYMEKNRSIARTVSIEALLQPRFHYAVNYFSFDAAKLREFFIRIYAKVDEKMKMLKRSVFLQTF